MSMIKHSQITQSNKFAISLQYLKKDVGKGGHFWHVDKRQSFCKLVLSFWMEVAEHVRNTQNRKLVVFLQYIMKNCRNWFVFYCDAKHWDILRDSSHVRCYLLLLFLFLKKNHTPYNQQLLTIERVTQISIFWLGLPNKKSNWKSTESNWNKKSKLVDFMGSFIRFDTK